MYEHVCESIQEHSHFYYKYGTSMAYTERADFYAIFVQELISGNTINAIEPARHSPYICL